MIHHKPNILVVCGRNKRRSRTAEHLFKNDSRFNIRSVGLSPKSPRTITERDIQWASLIFVMDDDQAKRITTTYRNNSLPDIQILHIDDVYEYLDPELIELLNDKIITTLTVEKYL